MSTPIEVGQFVVACMDCGRNLTHSRFTMEDAEQEAMENGFGVPGEFRCDGCAEKHHNPRGDYCKTEEYAYDQSSTYYGVEVELRKANKTHRCDRHRNCEIKPGQEYIRHSVAPWVMVADDVDDEGRTIGSRNNEWSISKWHRYADEHNSDRKED